MKELIDKWLNATCLYFDIDRATLLGRLRRKHINEARSVAMWFLYYDVRLTFKHIGKIFGGRAHSTVMSNIKNIDMDYAIGVRDLEKTKRQEGLAI